MNRRKFIASLIGIPLVAPLAVKAMVKKPHDDTYKFFAENIASQWGSSTKIKWRKYAPLPDITAPLAEGMSPKELTLKGTLIDDVVYIDKDGSHETV